jgi:hypothetical protein
LRQQGAANDADGMKDTVAAAFVGQHVEGTLVKVEVNGMSDGSHGSTGVNAGRSMPGKGDTVWIL